MKKGTCLIALVVSGWLLRMPTPMFASESSKEKEVEDSHLVCQAEALKKRLEKIKESAVRLGLHPGQSGIIQSIKEAEDKLNEIINHPSEINREFPEIEQIINSIVSAIGIESLPDETARGLINELLNLQLFAFLKPLKGDLFLRSFVLYDEGLVEDVAIRFDVELPYGWKGRAVLEGGENIFKEFLLTSFPPFARGSWTFKIKAEVRWSGGGTAVSRDLQWQNTSLVDFKVIGVFDNTDNKGMDVVYGPEKNIAKGINFSKVYPGRWKLPPRWRNLDKRNCSRAGGGAFLVNLIEEFRSLNLPTDDVVAYAATYIYSDEAKDVRFDLGTDDGCVLWLNGEEIHRHREPRGLRVGEDKIFAHLKKGWNQILLKVGQLGGGWGFCFQVFTPQGEPIQGVYCSAKKRLAR